MRTPKVDMKYEIATFEYKSELSGLKVCHKLNTLTSIEDQDLLSWRTCFYEVSRICRWSEEAKLEVLTQIVDPSIQHQIGICASSNEMMNKILKLKYNHNTVHVYQNRLANIHQINFYTIRAFVNVIQVNCNKIGICLDWNNLMTKAKIEETFFTGLNEKLKFELVRCNDKSFDNCFRILSEMDQLCNERIQSTFIMLDNEKFEPKNRDKTKYNLNSSRHRNERRMYDHRHKEKERKYCHVHKSSSHSDRECRSQIKNHKGNSSVKGTENFQRLDKNRKQFENNDKNEQRTYEVREPNPKPKILEVLLKVGDARLKAMIDTGSVDNYVPDSIITRLFPSK
ncbi:hypothetical protein DMUE_0498 [Dictyocoela muelleri]|nr:hypothetical protein DMUE_0498 [Dictyocoela muelleri]